MVNVPYYEGKFKKATPRTGRKEEAMHRQKEDYSKLSKRLPSTKGLSSLVNLEKSSEH